MDTAQVYIDAGSNTHITQLIVQLDVGSIALGEAVTLLSDLKPKQLPTCRLPVPALTALLSVLPRLHSVDIQVHCTGEGAMTIGAWHVDGGKELISAVSAHCGARLRAVRLRQVARDVELVKALNTLAPLRSLQTDWDAMDTLSPHAVSRLLPRMCGGLTCLTELGLGASIDNEATAGLCLPSLLGLRYCPGPKHTLPGFGMPASPDRSASASAPCASASGASSNSSSGGTSSSSSSGGLSPAGGSVSMTAKVPATPDPDPFEWPAMGASCSIGCLAAAFPNLQRVSGFSITARNTGDSEQDTVLCQRIEALAKRLVARRERYGPPTHTDGAAWAAEAEGEAATWVLSLCLQQETPVTHMRLAEGALAGVRYVQLCCAVRPRQERDVPVAEAAVEAWWADHDAAHASILSALPDLYALELKFVGTTSEPAAIMLRVLLAGAGRLPASTRVLVVTGQLKGFKVLAQSTLLDDVAAAAPHLRRVCFRGGFECLTDGLTCGSDGLWLHTLSNGRVIEMENEN